MQYSIKVLILLAVFGLLAFGYPGTPIASAEGISLKIKPTVLQIRATAPGDIHAPFQLQNLGDTPLTLKIILKRFRDAGDESGKIIYSSPDSAKTDNDSFLKQVHILVDGSPADTLTLGPQQEKELEMLISAAMPSQQDEYFSLIFVTTDQNPPQPDDPDTQDASFSTVQAGIALPVIMSMNADTKHTGVIDSFEAPLALQHGPVPFTVRVKNTGEHAIQAQGLILITNMFGQVVGRVPLPAANILAGSTRLLPSDASEIDKKARWSEKFLFGFYTAKLSLTFSPEESLYTRSVHFVAFPFSLLVGIGCISLFAFFLLRRIKRKVSEE